MENCYSCNQPIRIRSIECPSCGLSCSGEFRRARLARLPADMQRLAEKMILTAGNLKEVASQESVSYPTLRRRVDELIGRLGELQRNDENETNRLLQQVESGTMPAEQAARLIAEMNHGR